MPERAPTRVLFVDDEPTIRLTMPAVLQMHGFEVLAVATVPEALDVINRQPFDVLLADLNIGQPGDGFTVVSAMRRTQPNAVTIIITGYPAFETALEAIRKQVDDYIVKPADIPSLVECIERRLSSREPHHALPLRRMAVLLGEYLQDIEQDWLAMVDGDAEIAAVALSDAERSDHLPQIMGELIEMLQKHRGLISERAMQGAARHGHTRRRQGYTVSMVLKEARLLRRAILITVQRHLLSVEISYLLSDLIDLADSLDIQVRASIEAFLNPQSEQPRAA